MENRSNDAVMPAETSDASFFFCSTKDDRPSIEIAPVAAARPDADVEAVVLHDGDSGLPLGGVLHDGDTGLPLGEDPSDASADAAAPLMGHAGMSEQELAHFVRKAIATHGEAPANFHQATVYTVLHDPEVTERSKSLTLAMSWAMVLFQTAAAAAILIAFMSPSCSNQVQSPKRCEKGFWCKQKVALADPEVGVCTACSWNAPVAGGLRDFDVGMLEPKEERYVWRMTGPRLCDEYYRNASFLDAVYDEFTTEQAILFAPYEVTYHADDPHRASRLASWKRACDQCRDPTGAYLDIKEVIATKLRRLRILEWLTIILCVGLAGLCISSEVRDIKLSHMLIDMNPDSQTVGRRSALGEAWDTRLASLPAPLCCFWWLDRRTSLHWLMLFRQYITVVILNCLIPFIVVTTDGSATDVAGNTVAFLFLLEVDNAVWSIGMSEKSRSKIEEKGKVYMTESEAETLCQSKRITMALIVLSELVGAFAMGFSGDITLPCHITSVIAIWFSGVFDTVILMRKNSRAPEPQPYPNWKVRRHVWYELGCRHGGSRMTLVVSFVAGFILLLGPLEPPPIGFQLWRNALNGYREADDGTM